MKSFISLISDICANKLGAYDLLISCLAYKIDPEKNPISQDFIQQIISELESHARAGNTHCMVVLGNAYLNGWGVAQDVPKALDYARRAASLGNSGGEVLLGYLYLNGYGVVKDNNRALHWFKLALEKDDAMAANNIGYMYEQGLGVKKELSLAIKYYQQAAKQNNTLAIQNLERLTGKKL